MSKTRPSIASRKVIAVARRFGVPAKFLKTPHIKGRKDVSWPIVFSFSLSLTRFGIAPEDFRNALH